MGENKYCGCREVTLRNTFRDEEVTFKSLTDVQRFFGLNKYQMNQAVKGKFPLINDGEHYIIVGISDIKQMIQRGRQSSEQEQLCWNCKNAVGGCSWSRGGLKPVEGWTAEASIRDCGFYTWHVIDCPEFVYG